MADRAILQLETLVNQFDDLSSPVAERMRYFFELLVPSLFQMQVACLLCFYSIQMIHIFPIERAGRPVPRFRFLQISTGNL